MLHLFQRYSPANIAFIGLIMLRKYQGINRCRLFSYCIVLEPNGGEVISSEQLPAVEHESRFHHVVLHAVPVVRPELIPFGENGDGVRPTGCIVGVCTPVNQGALLFWTTRAEIVQK